VPKHKRRSWGFAVAVSLTTALGCNAVLGNEEGHLPDESGGDGNVSGGMTGKGGSGNGGGTATGGSNAGGAPSVETGGVPGDAGAGGEPGGGTGGSSTSGGKSSTGGKTSTGGKSGTGGTAQTGGRGGTTGTGGTSGGTPSKGGTTGSGGQTVPPGGSPSTGGSGGAATCATTEPSTCTSPTSVRYCDAGSYRTVSCATRCAEIGFDGTQAMCTSTICMCGEGLNEDCSDGVANYCSCASGGCTNEQFTVLYVNCYQGGTAEAALRCWADAIDCTNGAAVCGT